MANVTTDTKRLSEKLHERATAFATGAIDNQGVTLSIEEACEFVAWMHERSAEAKALERMLERRLKTSDIPGSGGAPPAVANDDVNVIPFVPRAGAHIIALHGPHGGAA